MSAPMPPFDPARCNLLRAFLRWSARRALRWVYRETVVVPLGRVPDTGPVLFVGNHPNDLPDVLLGLQACPRHVRYLATISAGAGGVASSMWVMGQPKIELACSWMLDVTPSMSSGSLTDVRRETQRDWPTEIG